jgi:3-oxoacyl-[acyl-carrier protein] reductase
MRPLERKVALVTGSARGIGRAIALRLARDGAAVAVNYSKSASAAEEVASDIRREGGRAVVLKADVGDPAQAKALVDETVSALGRFDILVNNAASIGFASLGEIDPGCVRADFATNVEGPIATMQAAVPRFPEDRGRVINLTSLVQLYPLPGATVYAATKGAIDAMTRVWAMELGARGITVNAVAPGPTATDAMRDVASEEMKRMFVARPDRA